MKHAAADMQKMFTDPTASTAMVDKALGDMKQRAARSGRAGAALSRRAEDVHGHAAVARAAGIAAGEWQPLKITKKDVARVYDGPRNPFDITFPQGVIWGLIGCVMTFGISLVTERTHGTLVRLRMAPLTRTQILGGKALSCFTSIMFVEVMLLAVALALRRAADVVRRCSRWPGCRRRSASSAS